MKNGTVEITLDKVRRLHADMNAICAIEELTGKPLLQALDMLGFEADGSGKSTMNPEKVQFRGLRMFLWALLLDEDPKITPNAVGKLMPTHPAGMKEVTEKVLQAWGPVWGAKEGAETESPFSDSDGPTSGP